MQDLQNELKSLKSLLLNRTGQRPYTPTTTTPSSLSTSASAPGLNLQSTNTTNGTDNNIIPQPLNAAHHHSGTETPPHVHAVAGSSSTTGAVPYGMGRPGIPAWQLAAREKAQQASKVEEEAPVA